MSAFDTVARGIRGITRAMLAISGLFFCLAVAGLTADIVSRAMLQSSIRGVDEVVVLLFVWIFMLGTAALYARNGDVALTIVVRTLPPRGRKLAALGVALVIAVSMALVFWQTVLLLWSQRGVVSADLGIPDAARFAPVAIATAFITFTSLVEAWSCAVWLLGGARPSVWGNATETH